MNSKEDFLILADKLGVDVRVRCERCNKQWAEEEHSCPYQADINDDPISQCNCCADCQDDCEMDI